MSAATWDTSCAAVTSAAWPTGSGHFRRAYAAKVSARSRTRSSRTPVAAHCRPALQAAPDQQAEQHPRFTQNAVRNAPRVKHEPPGPLETKPAEPARRQLLNAGNLLDGT